MSRVVEMNPPVCEFCGEFIKDEDQQCPARDGGGVLSVGYCPDCGGRLTTRTTPGGIPRRVCPECQGGERR